MPILHNSTFQPPEHFFFEQQGLLFPFEPRTISDIVWPSSNPFGVPDILAGMQAEKIEDPFTIWGSIPRTAVMTGTYGGFTDDYRFEALWNAPDKLVNSGCKVAVELNYSVSPRMPPAVVIYRTYQKRWLARYWQSQGVKIIVDVNVPEACFSLNLLGVPREFRAFMMRSHVGTHDLIPKYYERLCEYCGSDVFFAVYGGELHGEAHRICQAHGFAWKEDRMSSNRRERRRK